MLSIVDVHSVTTHWKRLWNEDAIFTMSLESNPGTPVMLCVAVDGISHSNGKASSEIAVNVLYQAVGETLMPLLPAISVAEDGCKARELLPGVLRSMILDVHRELCDRAVSLGDLGCTVSMALLLNDTLFAANVGDSPILLVTAEGLRQVYLPQNSGGDLSELSKWCGPPREILSQMQDIPVRVIPLEQDGILLVGTDGALAASALPADTLAALTETALREGWPMTTLIGTLCDVIDQGESTDNLSLIALRYGIA